MATTGPYIPRADGKFRDWLNNLARVIAQSPWAVSLSPAEAQALLDLAARYEAAFVGATSPGTRCIATVAAKNSARREAWATVRPLAMLIKANRGIDDGQKIALGIFPRRCGQSPIPRPRAAPALTLDHLTPGRHRLRYHDGAHPSRYAKPINTVQLELRIAVGRDPARSWREAARKHTATRHVFSVSFAAQDAGKTATYFGRWVTQRGLAGPWSPGLAVTIV